MSENCRKNRIGLMNEKCRVETRETNKIRQSKGRIMSEESDSTNETNMGLFVNIIVLFITACILILVVVLKMANSIYETCKFLTGSFFLKYIEVEYDEGAKETIGGLHCF